MFVAKKAPPIIQTDRPVCSSRLCGGKLIEACRHGFTVLMCVCFLATGCSERDAPSPEPAAKQTENKDALAETKAKADAGDKEALYTLSKAYRSGSGVDEDAALAEKYLKAAAEKQHPDAIADLADEKDILLFPFNFDSLVGKTPSEKLRSAEQHFAEAMRLYKTAADLGSYRAYEELGMHSLDGLSDLAKANGLQPTSVSPEFRPNIDKAISWFEKAAEGARPRALVALYQIHTRPHFEHVSPERASQWQAKIDKVDDPRSLSTIGSLTYYGFLDERSPGFIAVDDFVPLKEWAKEAKPHLSRAADKDDRDAQVLMARIYLGGFDGYKDPAEAGKWLSRAANAGDHWAQVTLGRQYMAGSGVVQDYAAAIDLFEKAANSKDRDRRVWEAQYLLGLLNEKGLGMQQDLSKAHAWYNIAATNKYDEAEKPRAALTARMSPDQLMVAQELAKKWKPGSELLTHGARSASMIVASEGDGRTKVGIGSGFVVSKQGYVVTNNHVAGSCKEVKIGAPAQVAKLVAIDQFNDLALLKLENEQRDVATLRSADDVAQGEDAVAYGFPLVGALSAGGNVTAGSIAAVTGLGNNTTQLQINAAIQQGNSGGPLFDRKGRVIGVVVMKLDAVKVAKMTGDVPQNVNFAVKHSVVKSFLDANKVAYSTGSWVAFDKTNQEIAEDAKRFTLLVECWR